MSDVLAGLGGAAAAGIVALGLAAGAAVSGLVAATKSAGEYAENVELAASKTHLSTDAVQELQYASKVTGVEFETISGSLTKLTKSMGAAQSGTGAQAQAFAELGVATTDANGNLLDSTQVYSDVIAALGQVENPAERDVLALQLLGRGATELNPLIDGTAGSLSDLAAQAHEAGAVLSDDMLAKLGSVDDAFDTLGAGVDAAKNALGLTLMPILQELGDQGTGLLGDFTRAVLNANGDLSQAAPAIGAVFGDAVQFLLGQVPKFLEVGTSIITALLSGIAKQAPALIEQAIPVLAGFVTTLIGQLPMLVDAGLKVLVALVKGIAAALPTLIPAAVSAVLGIVRALIANLPLLLNAGMELLGGLVTGIIAALPELIAALPQLITSLLTFIVGAIPTIIQAGVELLLSLVGALPEIIDGVVSAIPTIITGLILALVQAQPKLISAGIELFLGLVQALPQINTELIKAIPMIVIGLYEAFTDPKMVAELSKAGMELIEGLWKGIKDTGDWLWKQISGFFGGVIDNIKNLLGIHSPSTVFAGFGKNMVQGLEVGLSGSNNLTSIMGGLSDQVTSGFSGSLSAQARSAATAIPLDGTAVGAGSGLGGMPDINMPIYMLPEQDPRIAGRQFGREFARTMAGSAA